MPTGIAGLKHDVEEQTQIEANANRDGDKPDRCKSLLSALLIFPVYHNDLPGFGYLAGLIWGRQSGVALTKNGCTFFQRVLTDYISLKEHDAVGGF
ncbi:hypothetical protein THIOM_001122 [Candidatus Thiomargarita nelsonii]|uniref:Uncharacterized protein n=1 Tax=Candidatus Thiomargarita nelsonii TaxID=1003181 RepID=A0A0A6P0T0_9GAMM|nr:hypothetical protein THIOM_001122 [Candidatus Thiomargarita nelsonii]